MSESEIARKVGRGWDLERQIATLQDELKAIKAELAQLAPGQYYGENGHYAQVIQPSPGIKPTPEAIEEVRAIVGDDDRFKKLFEWVPCWKPVKDFRAKANVLLSPAKAQRVQETCEKAAEPYVVFK